MLTKTVYSILILTLFFDPGHSRHCIIYARLMGFSDINVKEIDSIRRLWRRRTVSTELHTSSRARVNRTSDIYRRAYSPEDNSKHGGNEAHLHPSRQSHR